MRVAVVLLNLGGPDKLSSVKPFLFNLFNDPAIIRLPKVFRYLLACFISNFRQKKSKAIYQKIGGKSPLLENTQQQAASLNETLQQHNLDAKVFICMRYWHPFTHETIKEVIDYQPDHIVLLPLYPQYSTVTTKSSFDEWDKYAKINQISIPTSYINEYYLNEGFIQANVELTLPLLDEALQYGRPLILFSAHGILQNVVDEGDPYAFQVEKCAEIIIFELKKLRPGSFDAKVCYQSRVGPSKWLQPYTDEEIIKASKSNKPILILPISFVSDHSETLVELDMDYKELSYQNKCPYYNRIPVVAKNSHFIECLSGLVVESLKK